MNYFKKSFMILMMVLVTAILGSATVYAEEINNSTEHYTVSDGTVYWESSWNCGSGRNNTVKPTNQYTQFRGKNEYPVWIDGYSIIDSEGNVVKAKFDERTQILNVPEITTGQQLMLHIWGADESAHRLGWIKYDNLRNNNTTSTYVLSEIQKGEEEKWLETANEKEVIQTADTLRKEVEADLEIPRQSIILADFSGSMFDFQTDVLVKLNGMEGEKIAFAKDFEEYDIEKDVYSYNIGGATDIANVLNKVDKTENAHIYLMSDLNDNCGTEITKSEEFIGEITIVYYPNSFWRAMSFFEELRVAYPNAKITGF